MDNFVRLRQICLATLDLQHHENSLSNILGIDPCHRSNLDHFGLENTLFAVNGTFIELVAPTRDNTAVHRFLDKTRGVGGYMAIFDCNDVQQRKNTAAELGISSIFERSNEAADLLQLNPKDTGLTMLEFDKHTGGEKMLGAYEWAGENWQKGINTRVTNSMTSLTMVCSDPSRRATQWSRLFGKPLATTEKGSQSLPLDYGTLNFEQNNTAHADHFSSLSLNVTDPNALLEKATNHGYAVTGSSFNACGVHFELMTTTP